jgi:hypothetical protein
MANVPDRTRVEAEGHMAVWIVVGGVKYKPRDREALKAFGHTGPVIMPMEELARIPTCPADGTLVIQDEDPTIYIIRYGLRFGLPSPEEFDASGLTRERVQELPSGSLDAFPYAGKWPPRIYWLIMMRLGRWLLRRIHSARVRRFARWIGNQAAAFVLGVVAGVITTVLVTGGLAFLVDP